MNCTQEQLRKIDALVAEHVMEYEIEGDRLKDKGVYDECGNWYPTYVLHYSTDISAAWEVWDKLHLIACEKYQSDRAEIILGYGRYFDISIKCLKESQILCMEADTAPLAICLAALKTKNIKEALWK